MVQPRSLSLILNDRKFDLNNWLASVALGRVDGATPYIIQGAADNAGASTVERVITPTFTTDPYIASATALEIVSSDAADTAAGGGARTVLVEGVAGDGTAESQVATMNGTTAVALSGTWLGVNRLTVLTSGATKVANGNIHVRDSGGGTVRFEYAGASLFTRGSYTGAFMTPNQHKLLIFDANYTFGATTAGPKVCMTIRQADGTKNQTAPIQVEGAVTQAMYLYTQFRVPVVIDAGQRMYLTYLRDGATVSEVRVNLNAVLIQTERVDGQ